jgi:SAM-dependent methyltransferase
LGKERIAMPIHYTDPSLDVPPGVDFLDSEQVRAWVAACENKPWRTPMRKHFVRLIGALSDGARVLELGSGPGLLAEAILQDCPNVERYTLLDFSLQMLALSEQRLARFEGVEFVQADFKKPDWFQALSGRYSAVVPMQAVHEIRHKRHVPGLYRQLRAMLEPGGLLAVCDGVPRDPSILSQVNLYMTAAEQMEAFEQAGFEQVILEEQSERVALVTGRTPR